MCVYGCNKLTECEFLLVDHHTFLPAEHPAQLSTFSQVIFMTPTSLGRLCSHQTTVMASTRETHKKKSSACVQIRSNTQMCTHTNLLSCPSPCQATTKANAGLPRMALREFLDTAKLNGVIASPPCIPNL